MRRVGQFLILGALVLPVVVAAAPAAAAPAPPTDGIFDDGVASPPDVPGNPRRQRRVDCRRRGAPPHRSAHGPGCIARDADRPRTRVGGDAEPAAHRRGLPGPGDQSRHHRLLRPCRARHSDHSGRAPQRAHRQPAMLPERRALHVRFPGRTPRQRHRRGDRRRCTRCTAVPGRGGWAQRLLRRHRLVRGQRREDPEPLADRFVRRSWRRHRAPRSHRRLRGQQGHRMVQLRRRCCTPVPRQVRGWPLARCVVRPDRQPLAELQRHRRDARRGTAVRSSDCGGPIGGPVARTTSCGSATSTSAPATTPRPCSPATSTRPRESCRSRRTTSVGCATPTPLAVPSTTRTTTGSSTSRSSAPPVRPRRPRSTTCSRSRSSTGGSSTTRRTAAPPSRSPTHGTRARRRSDSVRSRPPRAPPPMAASSPISPRPCACPHRCTAAAPAPVRIAPPTSRRPSPPERQRRC